MNAAEGEAFRPDADGFWNLLSALSCWSRHFDCRPCERDRRFIFPTALRSVVRRPQRVPVTIAVPCIPSSYLIIFRTREMQGKFPMLMPLRKLRIRFAETC